MKSQLIALLALLAAAGALAEPKINYVGSGRYTCSGSAKECAEVDQRNRALSDAEARSRTDREILREQQRQTRALEEMAREQRKAR